MLYIVIVALLIIVIIFGLASGAQSYATAQQAQAQIETAKVAQISSWGNVLAILTVMLIVLVVVALIALVLWVMWKRSAQRSAVTGLRPGQHSASGQRSVAAPREGPQLSINDLIQLEMLRSLRALNPPAAPALQDGRTQDVEQPAAEELFPWLR